jgi:hypothetical protein
MAGDEDAAAPWVTPLTNYETNSRSSVAAGIALRPIATFAAQAERGVELSGDPDAFKA